MADVKIPYYTVRRNGRGFWEPKAHMRALGFYSVPCGADGPDAWAIAEEWNRRWQAVRRGEAPSPAMVAADNLSPEQVGGIDGLSAALARRRRSGATGAPTSGELRQPRTREDWWRVLAADQAGVRRLRSAHGDARRHQRMAQDDRGDGFASRGTSLHENLAGAVEGGGGARLLRARR